MSALSCKQFRKVVHRGQRFWMFGAVRRSAVVERCKKVRASLTCSPADRQLTSRAVNRFRLFKKVKSQA
jgi:hypothetical protein